MQLYYYAKIALLSPNAQQYVNSNIPYQTGHAAQRNCLPVIVITLIENQVHWVKDVIFNEDKSRIKNKEVAGKFSLLVTLILNVYRSCGFISIKDGQSWLGKNWEKMLLVDGFDGS